MNENSQCFMYLFIVSNNQIIYDNISKKLYRIFSTASFTLLYEWRVISFLQLFEECDFILYCKMLCVNYSGHLHVYMSQILITLPINRELSSLKEKRGCICADLPRQNHIQTPNSSNDWSLTPKSGDDNDLIYLAIINWV